MVFICAANYAGYAVLKTPVW